MANLSSKLVYNTTRLSRKLCQTRNGMHDAWCMIKYTFFSFDPAHISRASPAVIFREVSSLLPVNACVNKWRGGYDTSGNSSLVFIFSLKSSSLLIFPHSPLPLLPPLCSLCPLSPISLPTPLILLSLPLPFPPFSPSPFPPPLTN